MAANFPRRNFLESYKICRAKISRWFLILTCHLFVDDPVHGTIPVLDDQHSNKHLHSAVILLQKITCHTGIRPCNQATEIFLIIISPNEVFHLLNSR